MGITNSQCQIQEQVQLSKQLEAHLQKMLYKIKHVHQNTVNTFEEVNQIMKESNNNPLMKANALNKLSSITYTANMFFQSMKKDVDMVKKNDVIGIPEIYSSELKKFTEEIKKFQVKSRLNESLYIYAEYYFNVLTGQFPSSSIDLIETNFTTNEEEDKAQMQEFVNRFIKADHIHQKALAKIEEDPVANQNITYQHVKNFEKMKSKASK